MSDLRGRKWVITQFVNDTFIIGFDFFALLKYDIVVVSPLHNEPSPHYHLIVQHKNAIAFTTLKRLMPYAHIEKQRGTNQEAYNYLIHKDDESKEQLKEEDIKANCDINILLNDEAFKDDIGIDIINAIEQCSHLWEVVKKFPNYWRDISKLKDLWNTYRIYKFHTRARDEEKLVDLLEEERRALNEVDETDLKGIID